MMKIIISCSTYPQVHMNYKDRPGYITKTFSYTVGKTKNITKKLTLDIQM